MASDLRTDTPSNLRGRINTLIGRAKTESGEEQAATMESAYARLRSWIESVVEREVLHGVSERLRPNMRMTSLPKIRGDRLPDVVSVLWPLYEKTSRLIPGHSQPLETLGITPSLQELEEDWKSAQDALTAYKA